MPDAASGKKRLEATDLVALAAAAAGVPAAILAGRPLSSLIAAILLIALIPYAASRLLKRSRPLQSLKTRRTISGLSILPVLIVGAGLLINSNTRAVLLAGAGGPESLLPKLANAEVQRNTDAQLIRIAIRNPSETESVLTDVLLSWESEPRKIGCLTGDHVFVVKDTISMFTRTGDGPAGSGREITGEIVEKTKSESDLGLLFSGDASGEIHKGCSRTLGRLSFSTSVKLPPHGVTIVAVVIPNELKMKSSDEKSDEKPVPYVDVPHSQHQAIAVSATINGDQYLTVCRTTEDPASTIHKRC
jgi:hypothetical protein